ncbi:MAG: hypothetical protein Q8R11_04175 [bacterium]|nr:hypothetical protein [bacterium]
MRTPLLAATDWILHAGIIALFFIPMLLIHPTLLGMTDVLKNTSFLVIGGIMFFAWVARIFLGRRMILVRSPLLTAYFLFFLVIIISSIGSTDRILSILPLGHETPPSPILLVSFGLTLVVLVTTIRTRTWLIRLFGVAIVLTGLLAIISLLRGFFVNALETAWLSASLLPLTMTFLLGLYRRAQHVRALVKKPVLERAQTATLTFLFGLSFIAQLFLILAINHPGITLLTGLGVLLLLGVLFFAHLPTSFPYSKALSAFVLLFLFMRLVVPSPWSISLPTQSPLPTDIGVLVVQKTFQEEPILWRIPFGLGPGTFSLALTLNQPGFALPGETNGIFSLLTTSGVLGTFFYIALFLLPLSLILREKKARHDPLLLAISGFLLIAALGNFFFLPSTSLFFLFLSLTALAVSFLKTTHPRKEIVLTFPQHQTASGGRRTIIPNPALELLPITILLLFGMLTLLLFWISNRLVTAHLSYIHAQTNITNAPVDAYADALAAVKTNPYVPAYRRLLGSLSLLLADATLRENPSNIDQGQKLAQQAIQEGRAAVSLGPKDSRNWLFYGDVYVNVSASNNPQGLTFAKDGYRQAARLAPNDPIPFLRLVDVFLLEKDPDTATTILRLIWDDPRLNPEDRERIAQDLKRLREEPQVAGSRSDGAVTGQQ